MNCRRATPFENMSQKSMQHVYLFLLYHVYSLFLRGGVDSCLMILCVSTLFEKVGPKCIMNASRRAAAAIRTETSDMAARGQPRGVVFSSTWHVVVPSNGCGDEIIM
jgi:hypothetical protein